MNGLLTDPAAFGLNIKVPASLRKTAVQDVTAPAPTTTTQASPSLTKGPTPAFDPTYAKIPQSMRELKRWLAFEVTWDAAANKFKKRPVNSKGMGINDPEDAESFESMLAFVRKHQGFVLGFYIEEPFIGTDIDDCRNAKTGVVDPKVMEIIRSLNTWTESSVSGTGIHAFMTGKKPGDSCRKGSVEIYSHSRPIAITGLQIEGTPATVNQADVTDLYNRMMGGEFFSEKQRAAYAKKGTSSGGRMESTSNIITTGLQVLMTGGVQVLKPFEMSDGLGTSIFYDSPSEAVQGLLTRLAIKHRNLEDDDRKEAMREDFENSKLFEQLPHWNSGENKWKRLGEGEIEHALEFIKKKATTTTATGGVQAGAAESLAWGEPKPFEPLLAPVPVFKIEYLPQSFRSWALDVAERMSIPLDYVGICMLCSFASVIGRRAFVQPKENDKSWTEPINLLGAVVAPSGGMKTPTWKTFTNEVTAIEIEWKKEHEQELQRFKAEMAKYLEKNRGKKKDAREGNPPEEPAQRRRLVINDATPESAHTLMEKHPEGLLLYRDEIGGWLAELDKQGRESAREMFLVAANGNDPHTQDRIGRGEVSAIMCLSFFGGMQPKIAQDLVNDERNAADGTIARLGLLSYPDRTDVARPLDRAVNDEARTLFRQALLAIAPLHQRDIFLKLSPEAQPIFTDWLRRHFEREFELTGPIASHFSKYKGLLPRIAALYHLADAASAAGAKAAAAEGRDISIGNEMSVAGFHLIGREHLERAINFLGEYLEPHMRRLYGCVKSPVQRAEAALAEHILAGDLEDGFTVRDVIRKGWSGLKEQGDVRYTLETFCERDWIRPMSTQGQVGQPTTRYEINPAMKPTAKNQEQAK